jgi:hypothetical protein
MMRAASRRGRRMRPAVLLLAVLAAGGQVACAPDGGSSAGGACGTPALTAGAYRPHLNLPGRRPGGGPGRALITPHVAPPAPAVPSRPPLPSLVAGRVMVSVANSSQTIVVPPGTLVEVRLDPDSGTAWTVPESTDPRALPRLSASGVCDTVKTATFLARGAGEILATAPHGEVDRSFAVTIRVTG